MKKKSINIAREKFLGSSLESSRKSYYPQLLEQLEDVKKSGKRLQLLIDSLPARVAYVNSKEIFLLVNEQYVKIFHKDKEKIIGNSVIDILGEKNYKNLYPHIQEVLHGNEVHFEAPIFTPEGIELWNEISYIPILSSSDHVEGFYTLAHDLTKRKRDEEEKKELELKLYETEKFKTIGTLAGGVAHDFNNLLTGILGHIGLMERMITPSSQLAEHVGAINKYAKSATHLTEQLLRLSRGGKYNVKPENINQLVLDYSDMFGRTKKELTIFKEIDPKDIVVDVDRHQIEQVILNLFINAWQAMPNGGDISVRTKVISLTEKECIVHELSSGSYACVSVADNGCGMTKEVQKHIFDPFFTTKEKNHGTGLGLATSYGIIKDHNGFISVNSEVGQGSTFNIYLPLSKKHVSSTKITEATYKQANGTALLIDDEKNILQIGKAMLESIGYKVVTAENGEDAIRHFQRDKNAIDFVIIDLVMPGMSGLEIFQKIREISPALPIILCSGYSPNKQIKEIMQKGSNSFLKKPFNISELALKITDSMKNSCNHKT